PSLLLAPAPARERSPRPATIGVGKGRRGLAAEARGWTRAGGSDAAAGGRSAGARDSRLPSAMATVAILAVGDELTTGQKIDTNSAWLSGRLLERGIETVEHATVADDPGAIGAAIVRLARAVD